MAVPVLILGSGPIARRLGTMLADDGRFVPTLASRDPEAGGIRAAATEGLQTVTLSGPSLRDALAEGMAGQRAVILAEAEESAAEVAAAAAARGCHYLDLLESPAAAAGVAQAAGSAPPGLCFAPGSGLAPGYVTALAAAEIAAAGPGAELTVFVGVLPARPANRLGYSNIWGVEGLLAEYTEPCLGLVNGRLARLPPLAEREEIEIAGRRYEAFTTAGSLDALAEAQAGRLAGLVFKTLRYPGHLDYIQFLLDDLGLGQQLYRLRSLLLSALPQTEEDRVLIAIRSRAPGAALPRWVTRVLGAAPRPGGGWTSAISTATAAHAAAVLDLVIAGRAGAAGLIQPGMVPIARLRESRFFAYFDRVGDMAAAETEDGPQ